VPVIPRLTPCVPAPRSSMRHGVSESRSTDCHPVQVLSRLVKPMENCDPQLSTFPNTDDSSRSLPRALLRSEPRMLRSL
jgi:hypothetical protein